MRFPETLKQPATFVAAALVAACLVALIAAIAGLLTINGVTQAASIKHSESSGTQPVVQISTEAPTPSQ